MAAEIGAKNLSTLLESLPGIASVLRSPVADALVNVIRAAAGLEDFRESDARELVQYATRRGLLGPDEGAQLLEDVRGTGKRSARKSVAKPKPAKAKVAKPSAPRRAVASAKPKTAPAERKKPSASGGPSKTTKAVKKKVAKKKVAKAVKAAPTPAKKKAVKKKVAKKAVKKVAKKAVKKAVKKVAKKAVKKAARPKNKRR